MFVGRKVEKEEIWKYIIEDEKIVKGRSVILYGQRRCGKSSLVNEIVLDMQESEEISNHSTIVQFSAVDSSYEEFESALCTKILLAVENTLRRKNELTAERKERIEKYRTSYNWEFFTEVVEDLFESDKEYGIVLVVDDCMSVTMEVLAECRRQTAWSEEMRYEFIKRTLGVITKLADIGITQVYIGNTDMRETLNELGLGNYFERNSFVMCLNALSDNDANT